MRAAAALPPGTFGRAYGDFMAARSFRADDRPPVRFVDDEELAYVATRAREVRPMTPCMPGSLSSAETAAPQSLAWAAVELARGCG
jgi:ubiquinone biosynthesis protein COQ4